MTIELEIITEDVAGAVLRASAEDFEQRGFGLWGIFDQATDELMGFCGLRRSGAA